MSFFTGVPNSIADIPLGQFSSEHDRLLVFRQYILHRLLVLSIYHPARGFNLFSTSTTSVERRELLVSARAALRMQINDKTIWANWDFVVSVSEFRSRDFADNLDDNLGSLVSAARNRRWSRRSRRYV